MVARFRHATAVKIAQTQQVSKVENDESKVVCDEKRGKKDYLITFCVSRCWAINGSHQIFNDHVIRFIGKDLFAAMIKWISSMISCYDNLHCHFEHHYFKCFASNLQTFLKLYISFSRYFS